MANIELQDVVTDDEILYRRIPINQPPTFFYSRDHKGIKVLAQAFSERPIPDGKDYAGEYRISVDRARLRHFNPELTRLSATSGNHEDYGVISMPAYDIRLIPKVDNIIPNPVVDNPAHALICITPSETNSRSGNKRIAKEVFAALADLANRTPWLIEPTG